MYTPIVLAPITDLVIWYLGIYGLAWAIVYSYPLLPVRKVFYGLEKKYDAAIFRVFTKLIDCIVCTSFWCAAIFVNSYFVPEVFLTKFLIVFSNVAFTWYMANKFGDYEDY